MRRAIVIGGSLAGLCAARVLSEHFEHVTVIERDALPDELGHRAGVPQSRHAHALLERGQRELDALFPGFSAELRAAGALEFDGGLGMATRRVHGWQRIGENDALMLCASRVLIEGTVRRLLRRHGKVELRAHTQMLGLVANGGRVRGTRVRDADMQTSELSAELVVDASGRSTRAERWLAECGLAAPDVERVDIQAGYASRIYQAPRERPPWMWWQGLWVEWEPPTLARAGVIFPIEGDRWFVTLAGVLDDRPPVDEAGFAAFAASLSSPALARAIALAEPLSDVAGSRALANVFRHYERWSTPLEGFCAVGDAVCAFNPIYGQGMSCAAACASILRDVLRTQPRVQLSRVFHQRQAAFLKGVWQLATGADFRWPHAEGTRPHRIPLVSSYLRVALEELHFEPAQRRRAIGVFNLTKPLTAMLEPSFAAAAMVSAARRKLEQRVHGLAPIPELPPPPESERGLPTFTPRWLSA